MNNDQRFMIFPFKITKTNTNTKILDFRFMIFPFKITNINTNPNTNTNNSHNRDKMNLGKKKKKRRNEPKKKKRERENEVVRWKNMEKARRLEVQVMASGEGLQVNQAGDDKCLGRR